ncbi:MAG: hypothetical protein ACKN83_11485 [Vulcanococcus sp.]
MTAALRSFPARWFSGAGLLLAGLMACPLPARALPFDPVPSGFQRWLNAQHDWPNNETRRFDQLAQCSDQTAASSPYRMAVYTCLKGRLTIERPGASQQCTLQRVSYFPANQRVRVWTGNCR